MSNCSEETRTNFCTLLPCAKLNDKVLFSVIIGVERLKQYYSHLVKTGLFNKQVQSQKDVALTSIDPQKSNQDKRCEADLERVSSLSAK